jgi:serine/threonine protein kinase
MTRTEYINHLLLTYRIVHATNEKADGCILHLRHKENENDLILRSHAVAVTAYEVLCDYRCNSLPLVYDVIALEDGQIVLEEYIDGITVAEVMESGSYRYSGARKVIRSVCHALNILHERNLVHRDIKPENVMIAKNGRVVLIDLNAARQISNASKDTVIMGTVGYASPEQLGVAQSDARTDIYALGVLLNVMITGKHPSEKLAKGKAGRIIRKCTSVNPDERYQSAEKLANTL